jgi:hypothetical protein
MKIQIHAPTHTQAASLAATLDLHLSQWEWVKNSIRYAEIEPLFNVLDGISPQQIAAVLREHQPTTGMQVAMGVTCKCGYWNGTEKPGVNRPVGLQGLQWHQANEIAKALRGES